MGQMEGIGNTHRRSSPTTARSEQHARQSMPPWTIALAVRDQPGKSSRTESCRGLISSPVGGPSDPNAEDVVCAYHSIGRLSRKAESLLGRSEAGSDVL